VPAPCQYAHRLAYLVGQARPFIRIQVQNWTRCCTSYSVQDKGLHSLSMPVIDVCEGLL